MSTVAEPAAPAATTSPPPAGALASGALGLPQVIFCIVTGAAPLAAMIFNVPITVLGGGSGAPGAFLLATVVLTIFSVGYIEMSRRVSAVGGFYTFVTRGFGPVMGLGSGILIALCYVIFSAAVMGTFGYFAATSIDAWTGVSIPAPVYTFGLLALITTLGFMHIELTAKVLGVALVLEILALLVLSVFVLGDGGGPDGLSAAPLNPLGIFDNEVAVGAFGAAAAGVAIFGAFWSWVGFEMAPNYAEESREPRKIAKVATYGSVIGLGVFYVFMTWIFVVGFGDEGLATSVGAYFEGGESPWYALTDQYVGSALTYAFEALVITSAFACAMAFYNTGSRYLFSLAREQTLPAALGRTHPRFHSPHLAALTVTAICAVYIGGFTIYDSSDAGFLLKLGTWSPLLGVLGILAVQAICSFAIVRYFLTSARDGFHWFKTLVAPLIGGVAQIGACWLLIDNRATLAGDGEVLYIKLLPWVPLVLFAVGAGMALLFRYRDKTRYESIGSIEAAQAGQAV